MSSIPLILSLWLHALATVVLIGYYLLLSLVYLPYLSQAFKGGAVGVALDDIAMRVRPWLYGSWLIFIVTGIYLMFGDTYYLGVGNFGNVWSMLMLVKHGLIMVMVGLSVFLNIILKRGIPFEPGGRIPLMVHTLSITGVLILLLTVMAQAQ